MRDRHPQAAGALPPLDTNQQIRSRRNRKFDDQLHHIGKIGKASLHYG